VSVLHFLHDGAHVQDSSLQMLPGSATPWQRYSKWSLITLGKLIGISGNIGKPTLDMVIFTSQLATALGPLGTIGLFVNYGFTAFILRAATPAFGRMAATEARLEGEYRSGLSRIGRDGEEVA
jgi:ABC-type uncharacterized transport system fused permease/ATPase subunit